MKVVARQFVKNKSNDMKYRIVKDAFGYEVQIKILWFWIDAEIFSEYGGFDTEQDAIDWVEKRTKKKEIIKTYN